MTSNSPVRLQRQLPPGVRDIFGANAHQLMKLSAELRDEFQRWGYEEVLPPTFEYYENVMRAFDEDFAAEIYRFVDAEGHLLALRPDLTVPVARLVAAKLYDQPMPRRLSYIAPVFRFSDQNGNRSRQLWQAGWELIGAGSPKADAEVIALLVTALERAGLQKFQVNLGHMGFVRATVEEARIGEAMLDGVMRAVDRKNKRSLARALDEADVQGPARHVLEALPDLWGAEEALARASDLAPNARASEAIEHLHDVLRILEGYGSKDRVTVDLGEVRGMDYYTGVTFEMFSSGSGFAIASGGRYDNLLARFGTDLPAVGAMIDLERVMTILNQPHGEPAPVLPDAIQQDCDHPECLRRLGELRRSGMRVELDVNGYSLPELRKVAAHRGIRTVIPCQVTTPTASSFPPQNHTELVP